MKYFKKIFLTIIVLSVAPRIFASGKRKELFDAKNEEASLIAQIARTRLKLENIREEKKIWQDLIKLKKKDIKDIEEKQKIIVIKIEYERQTIEDTQNYLESLKKIQNGMLEDALKQTILRKIFMEV